MAGESRNVNLCDWPVEYIPGVDSVYRQLHFSQRIKKGGRRYPNESHFKIHSGDKGLSVNWDKYCDVSTSFKLLGLQYKANSTFKDFREFKIFSLNVHWLRSLDEITEVIHDPIVYGNPSETGKPNNRSHSLIFMDDDPEVRLKMSDYCRENASECESEQDINILESEIKDLQSRLNDTPYHRCIWPL